MRSAENLPRNAVRELVIKKTLQARKNLRRRPAPEKMSPVQTAAMTTIFWNSFYRVAA